MTPQVQSFYDPATFTFIYVVYDRDGGRAAIVDPVLDYDPASARTSTASADGVLAFVREHALTVDWILETHAHADHLTEPAHGQRLGAFVLDELAGGPDDLHRPRRALPQGRGGPRDAHRADSTKTGCRGAIRARSSSLESASTPSKKTPTSAFHRRR